MPHNALKTLPAFKTEAEERTFWKAHDATDYLDLSEAQRVTFANLKPSTHRIALRLPTHTLEGIKNAANKRDVPYQSLSRLGCRRSWKTREYVQAHQYQLSTWLSVPV